MRERNCLSVARFGANHRSPGAHRRRVRICEGLPASRRAIFFEPLPQRRWHEIRVSRILECSNLLRSRFPKWPQPVRASAPRRTTCSRARVCIPCKCRRASSRDALLPGSASLHARPADARSCGTTTASSRQRSRERIAPEPASLRMEWVPAGAPPAIGVRAGLELCGLPEERDSGHSESRTVSRIAGAASPPTEARPRLPRRFPRREPRPGRFRRR